MANSGWVGMRPTQFTAQIRDDTSRRVRIIALAMLRRIVERSPVGNPALWKHPAPKGYIGGAFRANTIVSIGSPIYEFNENDIDKNGGPTIAKGARSISGLEPFTVVYITNSAPYAVRLENGWSSQAPMGIFGNAFNEVSEAYK